jgi:transcriptional regulator with XRE-family HTH domain
VNPKAATSIDVELGRRLRAMRKAAGLSQEEVAEKIGLTFQQIQKYEWGTNRLSVARMIQIAAALNQSASIFIDGLEDHLGGAKGRSTFPTSADVGLAYPRAKRVAVELKASAGRAKGKSNGNSKGK